MKRDYPYIRAWGRFMHSGSYYIQGELELARAENAPPDAICKNHFTGYWRRYTDIENEVTKDAIDRLVRDEDGAL